MIKATGIKKGISAMKNIRGWRYVVMLSLWVSGAHAQPSGWTVNAGSYQYTMSIVAFLNVDGKLLQDEGDKVAAFVGTEVRGVANPIYVASAGRHLAYLTVFANTNGESVTFKLFEKASSKVVDVDVNINFAIDGQYGNVFQAFSLANPALKNGADIERFYFTDADTVSTAIATENIDIVVEYDQDLTILTPAFVASEGARVYLERSLQESGMQTLDFSEPIAYTVLSEDESVKNTYRVSVTNQQTAEDGFACTNVITPNNDGANDHWIVQDVFKYENYSFRILDANGRIVFESTGYNNDWDGSYKGSRLSRGKYYFVISDPESGSAFSGDILILY